MSLEAVGSGRGIRPAHQDAPLGSGGAEAKLHNITTSPFSPGSSAFSLELIASHLNPDNLATRETRATLLVERVRQGLSRVADALGKQEWDNLSLATKFSRKGWPLAGKLLEVKGRYEGWVDRVTEGIESPRLQRVSRKALKKGFPLILTLSAGVLVTAFCAPPPGSISKPTPTPEPTPPPPGVTQITASHDLTQTHPILYQALGKADIKSICQVDDPTLTLLSDAGHLDQITDVFNQSAAIITSGNPEVDTLTDFGCQINTDNTLTAYFTDNSGAVWLVEDNNLIPAHFEGDKVVAGEAPNPDLNQDQLIDQGPQGTPVAVSSYEGLTQEQVQPLLGQYHYDDGTLEDIDYVNTYVDQYIGWLKEAGVDYDEVKIVTWDEDGFRWDVIALKDGYPATWLQVRDPNTETGWRLADRPSWQSTGFSPDDEKQFGLPALSNSDNHWDMVLYQGAITLVEINPQGQAVTIWDLDRQNKVDLMVVVIEPPPPTETQTDEQILSTVRVPDPAEYGLASEMQLYAAKVIRTEGTEGNPAYILFSATMTVEQESRDRVLLALDLETGVMEHAIYIEYEGVPLLIVTDNSVAEKKQSWFKLDSDDPQAEERLGESFIRALSLTWWGRLHPDDNPANGTYMPSLKEIPGYEWYVNNIFDLSKSQKQEISTHIMREFIKTIKEARSSQTVIEINLRDKSRQIYDPSKDTLVIKVIVDSTIDEGERSGPSWNGILSIPSEKRGSLLKIFYVKQLLMERREIGSSIITFFRYFFGGKYQGSSITTPGVGIAGGDMTGPILTAACEPGSIPDALENFSSSIYPLYDTGEIAPAAQCAVQLGR